MEKSYRVWSKTFYSPSRAAFELMANQKTQQDKVLILVRLDENTQDRAGLILESLENSVGQEWAAFFQPRGNLKITCEENSQAS